MDWTLRADTLSGHDKVCGYISGVAWTLCWDLWIFETNDSFPVTFALHPDNETCKIISKCFSTENVPYQVLLH